MPLKETPISLAPCQGRELLADLQVTDKWVTLIIYGLLKGPLRFNEIRRSIEGISQKMLAHNLRGLERNGMVNRKVNDTTPVTVEYSLTPLGKSFEIPLQALFDWIRLHQAELLHAQGNFDAQQHDVARPSVHSR